MDWIFNRMNIKWMDHRKNRLDHKNWIFCPPLELKNGRGVIVFFFFYFTTFIKCILSKITFFKQ